MGKKQKKTKTVQKTIKTPVFYRTNGIDTRKLDDETRTVSLSFSSEDPYERYFGIEILDHSADAVNMDFIASGRAPLLKDHWGDNQIGVVESAEIGTDRKGRATVRFGKNDLAEQEYVDVKDGIRQNISVGYQVHKMVLEEENEDGPDIYRVVSWTPLEISTVGIPADQTVGIGRDGDIQDRQFDTIIETRAAVEPEPAKIEVKKMDKTPEEIAAEKAAKEEREAARLRDISEKAANEAREIIALGAQHGFETEATEALKEGTSVDSFRAWVLDKLAEGQTPAKTPEIGLTEKETQRFSFFRIARAALLGPKNPEFIKQAGFEIECSVAAAQKRKEDGLVTKGYAIPHDVMVSTRTLTAGTATDGAELVADNLLAGSFIDVLRNMTVVAQMGATMLPGLVGDVLIPRKTSGASGGWISTETGDAANSEAQFDQVSLTPKTVGAYTDISRQLLMQSTPAAEGLIRNDLAMAIAISLDLASLYGSGASGEPTGISETTGINKPTAFAAAVPTWAEVVAMESAVATDNALLGSLGYIIEAAMRGSLKTTEKASNTAQFIMPENGSELNGYKTGVTNQVTSGDVFFGNWADMLVGLWGGLDLLADPYTNSLSGTLRLVVHQSADVAVRHPESFAVNNDA